MLSINLTPEWKVTPSTASDGKLNGEMQGRSAKKKRKRKKGPEAGGSVHVQHVKHAQWLVCVCVCVWRAGPWIVLLLKSVSPSQNAFLQWLERTTPTPQTTQPLTPPQTPPPPQSIKQTKKPTHKTVNKNKQQQNKRAKQKTGTQKTRTYKRLERHAQFNFTSVLSGIGDSCVLSARAEHHPAVTTSGSAHTSSFFVISLGRVCARTRRIGWFNALRVTPKTTTTKISFSKCENIALNLFSPLVILIGHTQFCCCEDLFL